MQFSLSLIMLILYDVLHLIYTFLVDLCKLCLVDFNNNSPQNVCLLDLLISYLPVYITLFFV